MKSEEFSVLNYYTLFSGIFRYNKKDIGTATFRQHYGNWTERIPEAGRKSTLNHLASQYYDNFISNVFPEVAENPQRIRHFTKKTFLDKPLSIQFNIKGHDRRLDLEYFDLFLFHGGIGIFSFKLSPQYELTNHLQDISDLLFTCRNMDSHIKEEGQDLVFRDFLKKQIEPSLQLDENWLHFSPQLKTYSIINIDCPQGYPDYDALLFDLGTIAPIGTALGNSTMAPSDAYYNELISKNKISVYKNWAALCLFDTFTRISCNQEDRFRSWELEYFHIFVSVLYNKAFMYSTNAQLSDVTIVNRKTEKLKNEFVEFVNDYHLTHISYKFLPNLLYDRICHAMDIQSEVEQMELKIRRINETFQSKRDRMLNTIITILAFVSVFSVIADFSGLLEDFGLHHSIIYPWGSVGLLLAVMLLLAGILGYYKRK